MTKKEEYNLYNKTLIELINVLVENGNITTRTEEAMKNILEDMQSAVSTLIEVDEQKAIDERTRKWKEVQPIITRMKIKKPYESIKHVGIYVEDPIPQPKLPPEDLQHAGYIMWLEAFKRGIEGIQIKDPTSKHRIVDGKDTKAYRQYKEWLDEWIKNNTSVQELKDKYGRSSKDINSIKPS